MENDKIISSANLLQYFLSPEISSKRKTEFILPYLVRNFQLIKLIAKYLQHSPIIKDLILNMAVKFM